MSLVLSPPRSLSLRAPTLVAACLLTSAVGLAPTLVKSAGAAGRVVTCPCVHCPGGTRCCCRTKAFCATP